MPVRHFQDPSINFSEHSCHMRTALALAHKASSQGDVPIGCVIVDNSGKVIGKGLNLKEKYQDASLHAEMVALKSAAQELKSWRLIGCSVYVTLEPCTMCLASMVQFRIEALFFGAYDLKGGAISLNFPFYKNPKLNHNFSVMGGLLHCECSQVLSDFFRQKRGRSKN